MFLRSLAIVIACNLVPALCDPNRTRKPVIIDTDIFSSADDTGALAVVNVLHNRGQAELLGVVVNTPSKYGFQAVDVINTFYGNSHIPIASIKPLTEETYFDNNTFIRGEFASKIAYNFPHTQNVSAASLDPVTLYRRLLGNAEDNSTTVISLGFFDNLSALLNSTADQHSPHSGSELVARKVQELVIMGGDYPSGLEYNFGGSTPLATYHVVNSWPSPMTFSGFSLGDKIRAGSGLAARQTSPVLAAYRWYEGCGLTRSSWDPVTALYGILGLSGLFKYGVEYGYNYVFPNGSNTWVYDKRVSNQRWIEIADRGSNVTVANVLDELYARSI